MRGRRSATVQLQLVKNGALLITGRCRSDNVRVRADHVGADGLPRLGRARSGTSGAMSRPRPPRSGHLNDVKSNTKSNTKKNAASRKSTRDAMYCNLSRSVCAYAYPGAVRETEVCSMQRFSYWVVNWQSVPTSTTTGSGGRYTY
eukprot:1104668-Rhodomonas_salina.1